MKIISYYTKRTPYEESVRDLVGSMGKFDLKFHIEAINDLGNWIKNTAYKPVYCWRMLDLHQEPLVYLDVDAEVLSDPKLLKEIPDDVDLALCYNEGAYLAGTIYFANNFRVREFLADWITENFCHPKISEQINLRRIIENKWKDRLSILKLPLGYCFFDELKDVDPVVIKHFRLSRRLKNGKI